MPRGDRALTASDRGRSRRLDRVRREKVESREVARSSKHLTGNCRIGKPAAAGLPTQFLLGEVVASEHGLLQLGRARINALYTCGREHARDGGFMHEARAAPELHTGIQHAE